MRAWLLSERQQMLLLQVLHSTEKQRDHVEFWLHLLQATISDAQCQGNTALAQAVHLSQQRGLLA